MGDAMVGKYKMVYSIAVVMTCLSYMQNKTKSSTLIVMMMMSQKISQTPYAR